MGEPKPLIEMPFADGSVGYLIPKNIDHYDLPDQPLRWRGTIEYPPLFEPMEVEKEKKEEREEEEEREKEGEKEEEKKEEEKKEEVEKEEEETDEEEIEEEGKKQESEIFVVSSKLEKMKEGTDRTAFEESASDFEQIIDHLTPTEEDGDWAEMQAMGEEIDTDKLVDEMSPKELEEIDGARADKVSSVYKICEDYGKAKEELTGLWLNCKTYSKSADWGMQKKKRIRKSR